MALVLDHFQGIPIDVTSMGHRFSDSVPALVGCVTTAARHIHQLDDGSVRDLIVRASRRVDEVTRATSWLSEKHRSTGQQAMSDALVALRMALGVLEDAWNELSPDEKQNLLGTAMTSLARFCYLSRPAGSSANVR